MTLKTSIKDVSRYQSAGPLLAQGNSQKAPLKRLSIPARPFCTHPHAFVDPSINQCVHINHHIKELPIFSPCPPGTQLHHRRCEGQIVSELEDACPVGLRLNAENQCVKADVYVPPNVVCPEGYRYHRHLNNHARTCKKDSWVDPLYTESFDTNKEGWPELLDLEDQQKASSGCTDGLNSSSHRASHTNTTLNRDCRATPATPLSVLCPNGYRLVRPLHTPHGTSATTTKHGKPKKGPLCHAVLTVAPHPKDGCMPRYRWSSALRACIRMAGALPIKQCPRPDPMPGAARGDWYTPSFSYDPTCGKCTATSARALHPQCPPGWELTGLMYSTCYKKILAPIQYDCGNTESHIFKLRWDKETQTAVCEVSYAPEQYSEGPSFLTRRSRINAKMLEKRTTPWGVLRGYAKGYREEKKSQSIAAAAAVKTGAIPQSDRTQGELEGAFAELREEEAEALKLALSKTTSIDSLPAMPTVVPDAETINSASDDTKKWIMESVFLPPSMLEHLSSLKTKLTHEASGMLGASATEKVDVDGVYGVPRGVHPLFDDEASFERFHDLHPTDRKDLLKPRDPGSFTTSFKTPVKDNKKLYSYVTRAGLF